MKKYTYQIALDTQNSPPFLTKEEMMEIWKVTHRTSSIWRIWNDEQTGKQRFEQIGFKVVYSDEELRKMPPNMLKAKYNEYKEFMTDATLKRLLTVAKQRRIYL